MLSRSCSCGRCTLAGQTPCCFRYYAQTRNLLSIDAYNAKIARCVSIFDQVDQKILNLTDSAIQLTADLFCQTVQSRMLYFAWWSIVFAYEQEVAIHASCPPRIDDTQRLADVSHLLISYILCTCCWLRDRYFRYSEMLHLHCAVTHFVEVAGRHQY